MPPRFRISSLVPSGLAVEGVSCVAEAIEVTARAEASIAACPLCGAASRRVHSRYIRQVSDLPCSGRRIHLRVVTRRFVCSAPHCRRRIFAERFGDTVLAVRSRRTTRLECLVHHLGLALGGRPAASFARRLMLPVSNDTLLRVVRRRASLPDDRLNVIGIDDWAWRRSHRYGTIVCDLERRRIVTLLPDREIATVEACSPIIRRSPSSHETAAVATARRRQEHCPTRPRSPIAGISWRTRVRPSSMPCASRCGRSVPRSAPRRSIRICSPPRRSSNMRDICGVRRRMPRS